MSDACQLRLHTVRVRGGFVFSFVSIGCLMLLFIVIVLCLLAVVMLLGSWARLALLSDACQLRLHIARIRGGFVRHGLFF